jgi:transposase-like protein
MLMARHNVNAAKAFFSTAILRQEQSPKTIAFDDYAAWHRGCARCWRMACCVGVNAG